MAEEKPSGVSRRNLLAGMAAVPLTATPLVQAALPQKALEAIIAANGFSVAKLLDWTQRLSSYASAIDNYGEYERILAEVCSPTISDEMRLFNFCNLMAGLECHMSMEKGPHETTVGELFNGEAKLAYAVSYWGEDIDPHAWQEDTLFTDHKEQWAGAQRLCERLGIPLDSPMDLLEFADTVREKAMAEALPSIQAMVRQNPKQCMQHVSNYLRFNPMPPERLAQMESVFGPMQGVAPDAKGWLSKSAEAIRQQQREVEEDALHYAMYRIEADPNQVDKTRYAVHLDSPWDSEKLKRKLIRQHPELEDKSIDWQRTILTVPTDAVVKERLDALSVNVGMKPTPRIAGEKSAQPMGTALQCAATAQELKR